MFKDMTVSNTIMDEFKGFLSTAQVKCVSCLNKDYGLMNSKNMII